MMRLPNARLGLAALLFAAEFWICVLALHPQVGPKYRARYIANPPSCWLSARDRTAVQAQPVPDRTDIGALRWPRSCFILRAGWSGEGWGAWTIGRLALLRLPVRPDTRAVRLSFSAPAFLPKAEAATLIPDHGRPIRIDVPPNGQTELSMPVDQAARSVGWMDLRIMIDRPHSPASFGAGADRRRIGIGLLRIELQSGAARP